MIPAVVVFEDQMRHRCDHCEVPEKMIVQRGGVPSLKEQGFLVLELPSSESWVQGVFGLWKEEQNVWELCLLTPLVPHLSLRASTLFPPTPRPTLLVP